MLVSGFGLFSEGYNIQIIGYMNVVLTALYPDAQTNAMKTRLLNSTLFGEIVGMLLFGLCIDRWGRKLGMFATILLLVSGTTLATAAHGKVISRGIAGVGAGGEYSVRATQATEAATRMDMYKNAAGPCWKRHHGIPHVRIHFLWYCLHIVIAAYGGKATNSVWRISFGIGIFLPLVIFLFRLRIVNSTQFHKHAIRDKRKFPLWLAVRRYWKPLLGCAGTWFLYGFISYLCLCRPSWQAWVTDSSADYRMVAVISIFSLPGAIIGGFLVVLIGRRRTFAFGFSLVAVLGFIIGGAMVPLHANSRHSSFYLAFSIFSCHWDLAPALSLSRPNRSRRPCGDTSSGFRGDGKVGAAIGTQVFPAIIASYPTEIKGQQVAFLIGAGIAVLGTVMVLTLIPDREKQLESEDALFEAYLGEKGWDTSRMGLRLED
ncbi:major facilitator superfamily domain-containing protein [Infundibulicybe gibba]|nr:major facilitator superfamily domain-containing protein [Infundibulicybe gibba]